MSQPETALPTLLDIAQPDTAPEGAARVDAVVDVDLADPLTFGHGHPHEAFDRLREAAPIAWHDELVQRAVSLQSVGETAPFSPGFWAVTNHELVSEVSKHPELFSSHIGGTQLENLPPTLMAGLRLMLLNLDPPEQTRIRKLLVPSFTPRSVDLLTDSVSANARELAEALQAGSGSVDLVETVTKQLPTRTIADMLGMPEEDRHLIPKWSDSLIAGQAAESGDDAMLASVMAFAEIHDYGATMLADRRANPRQDIVSSLAVAEVDGERLSVEEFCMFWLLLIVAGNETTRNSLSGAVIALQQQGLWKGLSEQVRAHGPLGHAAAEELVRFVTPVMQFRRTATQDVELGGQHIRAGDKVVMWYAAANRDPGQFAEPHALDLTRDPNPHLAFGVGPHFCLGTRVARLQITVMLTELLTRFPDLSLAGEPTYVPSTFIHGIEHLPVGVGA